MRSSLLPVCVLTFTLCLPLFAQTDAGTPPVTSSAPADRPLPQKLLLPTEGEQMGSITTPRAPYQSGQTVPITFTVTNTAKTDAVYNFQTGQKFDITVLDTKGNTVWQWSHGKVFTQSLSRLSLAPGQRVVYNTIWNGRDTAGNPVPPGLYTLNARLTSANGTTITGGFLVNTDTDPNNMGTPTRTPAETGAIRQVDTTPLVTASKRIAIGVPVSRSTEKK